MCVCVCVCVCVRVRVRVREREMRRPVPHFRPRTGLKESHAHQQGGGGLTNEITISCQNVCFGENVRFLLDFISTTR